MDKKFIGRYLKKDDYTVVNVWKDLNSNSYRFIRMNDNIIVYLSPERLQNNFISIEELLKD